MLSRNRGSLGTRVVIKYRKDAEPMFSVVYANQKALISAKPREFPKSRNRFSGVLARCTGIRLISPDKSGAVVRSLIFASVIVALQARRREQRKTRSLDIYRPEYRDVTQKAAAFAKFSPLQSASQRIGTWNDQQFNQTGEVEK